MSCSLMCVYIWCWKDITALLLVCLFSPGGVDQILDRYICNIVNTLCNKKSNKKIHTYTY